MMEPSQIENTAKSVRLLQLLKDNRMEMMVVTILLYSTGLLEQTVAYAGGVC